MKNDILLKQYCVCYAKDRSGNKRAFVNYYEKNKNVICRSKFNLIKFIVSNITLLFNVTVYGSAVSSFFSGIEPNDIDLKYSCEKTLKKMINFLRSIFELKYMSISMYDIGSKYTFIINGIELDFDFVILKQSDIPLFIDFEESCVFIINNKFF